MFISIQFTTRWLSIAFDGDDALKLGLLIQNVCCDILYYKMLYKTEKEAEKNAPKRLLFNTKIFIRNSSQSLPLAKCLDKMS